MGERAEGGSQDADKRRDIGKLAAIESGAGTDAKGQD